MHIKLALNTNTMHLFQIWKQQSLQGVIPTPLSIYTSALLYVSNIALNLKQL